MTDKPGFKELLRIFGPEVAKDTGDGHYFLALGGKLDSRDPSMETRIAEDFNHYSELINPVSCFFRDLIGTLGDSSWTHHSDFEKYMKENDANTSNVGLFFEAEYIEQDWVIERLKTVAAGKFDNLTGGFFAQKEINQGKQNKLKQDIVFWLNSLSPARWEVKKVRGVEKFTTTEMVANPYDFIHAVSLATETNLTLPLKGTPGFARIDTAELLKSKDPIAGIRKLEGSAALKGLEAPSEFAQDLKDFKPPAPS